MTSINFHTNDLKSLAVARSRRKTSQQLFDTRTRAASQQDTRRLVQLTMDSWDEVNDLLDTLMTVSLLVLRPRKLN